jgi:hypothetical protein
LQTKTPQEKGRQKLKPNKGTQNPKTKNKKDVRMPSIPIGHKLEQKRAFIIVNGPFAGVSDGLFGCDDVHAVDLGVQRQR